MEELEEAAWSLSSELKLAFEEVCPIRKVKQKVLIPWSSCESDLVKFGLRLELRRTRDEEIDVLRMSKQIGSTNFCNEIGSVAEAVRLDKILPRNPQLHQKIRW